MINQPRVPAKAGQAPARLWTPTSGSRRSTLYRWPRACMSLRSAISGAVSRLRWSCMRERTPGVEAQDPIAPGRSADGVREPVTDLVTLDCGELEHQ